ncbi:hypothetical protein A1OE_373 [Candidatus Endolissoclinum faulkneri L2]|uniref:Uncharacterized protein n=1 Tax=Candidatus Endolissoclinum faulkneri L2 TaxID=1193729 RepID=K7Z3K7_9PROT|nr:hypothetical protein A1OE_373 [Candidatus Endolissoclinum faulkneri L2]
MLINKLIITNKTYNCSKLVDQSRIESVSPFSLIMIKKLLPFAVKNLYSLTIHV